MNADEIRAHIADLIKQKGKNLRSLSLAVGKNEAYLHQFIHKGSPVRLPEEDRRKLADLLDVEEQELTDIRLPNVLPSYTKHAKTALLEMWSVDTACSTVGFFSMPSADFSNITSTTPNDVKMISVKGDSMSPTLQDGDYVFADISQKDFSTDGLYLIQSADRLTVKRLQQINTSDLWIISDNTHYKSISSPRKDLTIVGKIILILKAEKIG